MLSYIYRIACHFEHSHGIRPNLLYLNQIHLHHLKEQLEEIESLDEMAKLLGMEIIVTSEAIHPHVAAANLQQRPAMAM